MSSSLSSPSLPHWIDTVHHDGSALFLSNPSPRLGETVQIRLRASLHAPIRRVFLRTFPDGEQAFALMKPGAVEAPARWWSFDLKIDQPVVHYRFILQANDGIWWYNAAGPQFYDPLDSADFQILADYHTPAWLHSAVFYQIFPDRFANGDLTNDVQPGEYEFRGNRPHTYLWGTLPPENDFFSLVFYGGDLQGIRQRLDYIQELGVNALYLTPVFSAFSNHKYDVADYKQVDLHFGGDQALIELRQALDERQMRYILDIVPNHCGYWHPWFQAARADANAPEAEFFTFNRHPDEYASWLGVWTLPKLNYRSAELRRRMITAPDSVFRYWLQPPFSADGWRIDVANMLARQGESQLGPQIARDIRQAVKETNPDAYLLGENFFDATPQLLGDQWDAVMNYSGFRKPLMYWLSGFKQGAWGLKEQITSPTPFSTAALVSTWRAHLGAIPWVVALQQFNLLNSHDTPRLRTAVNGSEALHKLAAILLFTYPGVPCLYYGDEVGLQDLPRLNSRGTMPWEPAEWDHDLLAFYKKLIHLRRASAVLQTGSLQIIAVEEDTLAYLRQNEHGRILVIAHRSPQPRRSAALMVAPGGIPDGAQFEEYFSGHTLTVASGVLTLPDHPQGATLWIQIG